MEERLLLFFSVVLFAHMTFSVPPPRHHGPTVPASECRSLMDLVLVVDGSDSISRADYSKQRLALKSLVNELHLGPTQSRVGIVVYSTTIAQVLNLTANREDLVKGARSLVHPQDGTKTALGIFTARQMFKDHGRDNVPWVCIVITDGMSKEPLKTANESAILQKMGANMFAVGISHFIDQSELENIASTPKQVLRLKTFDQLRMSLSKLMKVVCPCPPPPHIKKGDFDQGKRSIGSIRTATCKKGFQPVGNPTIECLKDSTWSPLNFSCKACPNPDMYFGNGVMSKGSRKVGSWREYICKKGYTTPEPILITCVEGPYGPVWTVPSITCKACPPVPLMPNAYVKTPVYNAVIGTVVTYHCNKTHIETGTIESTCVDTKGIPRWTKPNHTCIACGPPPPVPFADVDLSNITTVNTVRVYTCKYGYHPTGPIEAICIGQKGTTFWKLTKHTCRGCDKPPKLTNGIMQAGGDSLIGSKRTYICKKGYQETGPLEAICKANHGATFWDGLDNKCIPCNPPPHIPNTIMDPTGDNLLGSIRRYKCLDTHVATGPIEIGCVRGTGGPLWTSPEFICITCPPPPEEPFATLDHKGDNFVGHYRKYHCVNGYVPSKPGPITRQCIGEYIGDRGRAYWGPPSHHCRACKEPPKMDYADAEPGDIIIGSKRRYKCHYGFYATGTIEIECLSNAVWSKPNHTCTACGPTPDVPNADVVPGLHTLGTVRKYVCHKGLVPKGSPKITCLKQAKWSPVNFTCVGCLEPYNLKHAVLEPGINHVHSIRRYTCLPGYYATGEITTTCAVPPHSELPDWSTPVHYCKDCGEPHPVKNAYAKNGTRTIGSKQMYVCHKGFVASGPPVAHCMQNGEWSLPNFKCITCGDPPKIEHAEVDKVGTNNVESVRAYMCNKGFVATGPIEAKCVTDAPYGTPYWKNMTANKCRDCGVPPNVTNAYASIGPAIIGSELKYSCDEGFVMKGYNRIECLVTGIWSQPEFSCELKPVTTTTTPAPVPNDPSVCDGCRMLNGVGYMKHPDDCTQFVQCFYNDRGGIQGIYMPCPFGQYWDQGDLTCKPADDVDCPNERCLDPNVYSYKCSDNTKCCAYWECVNGKSKAKCCGAGFRYISGKGCEPDPSCNADCPWEDMFPACDKRPLLDMTRYEQHIGNGYFMKMPCAPGTAFDIIDCRCSLRTNVVPGFVCRPEIHLNFDNDDTEDHSGRNVYIINEGVRPYKGAAYFDGNSRLLVNRFSNTAFHGNFVIKLRYKEKLEGPTANALQALVTNGDCGDDPSIIIAKMPGYVMCGAKTSRPKSFALPTTDKEWKEVIYIHDEKRLEGKVCGAAYDKWSLGPIKSTHCGLQIGYGTMMANYVGLMDDISVYQCRPPEDILSVYGGRRIVPSMKIH
ncbi:sushi, von Willebrand factor type A, EGF and pentraxin domain-containing protein 1-like [Mercenaria mercenaria]|uniref:sushi, von Willebrand factor type A, EGF and pentraxin domain-containing protein 1-like n=1 Tax=Mercenaria mercenaria TaxID=6596 RepID=UPI00234F15E9|nr:sushi, von Willebrand factor type A, EGF and pentraxin domain-containing protein 1-like [Mercenaria mercenaria]